MRIGRVIWEAVAVAILMCLDVKPRRKEAAMRPDSMTSGCFDAHCTLLRLPGDEYRSQHHNQRIYWPEIVRFRMREVVRQWEEEQHNGESDRQGSVALPDSAKSQQPENRHGRIHKNVGWVQWFLLQVLATEAPVSGPHIHDPACGHPPEPSRMAMNVGFRLCQLVVHVSDLTDALVLGEFRVAVVG